MDCSAEDIIYVIECAGCNIQYIGETGNLRDQVRVYKQHIFTPYLRNQCQPSYSTLCNWKENTLQNNTDPPR